MPDNMERKNEILVAGHRGCLAIRPENTMCSFTKALELGVDMIEMDINITKDKQLVVMHDNTVDRTTDGTGHIHDKTLAEIKKLDAGIRFSPEFTGERVPTFEEFLALVDEYKDLLLNVEIKEKTLETVDLTIEMLRRHNLMERIVIACFDADIVKYAHVRYGVRTQGFPDEMMDHFEPGENGTRSALYSVGIPMKLVSRELTEHYRRAGIKPWSWVVNDEAAAEASREAGIILVTSNDPAVPLSYYRKKGLHR